MFRVSWRVRVVTVFATLSIPTLGLSASPSAQSGPNRDLVSVKVTDEMAPPGGMAQIKVVVTELTPISTGDAVFSFDVYGSIEGIALPSDAVDAGGVAVVRGTNVAVSLLSPSAMLGVSKYPILAVTGHIPVDTPIGLKFPLVIDPDVLQLFDASGAPYLTAAKRGHLITAPGVAIHDVTPGSAELQAGSVVTIYGSSFEPQTKVRFKDTLLDQVRYVSADQIDVVLGQPASMHGMRISAENADGSRSTYFSYQRTKRAGRSAHPVLQDVVPMFPRLMVQTAELRLSGAAAGIALQNLEPSAVDVVAELSTSDGTPIAATVVTVPSNHYVLGEISEVFRVPDPGSSIVSVTAVTPVQVLGVIVDGAGRVTPRLPE